MTRSIDVGKVLDLRMSEGTGTVVHDVSGEGNDGTLTKSNGVLPQWTDSKSGFGKALDFDGTGAYLEVADDASLTFGDGTDDEPFSVSAWINADDITDFCPIGKGIYNTDAEWILFTDSDNKIRFATYDESVANCYIGRMFDTTLAGYEDEDIHIGGSYDGSEASTGFKIYVNGRRVDDADYENEAGSYVAMENGLAHAVWIGRNDTEYANGEVDEAIVWNRELSPQEFRTLYEMRGKI